MQLNLYPKNGNKLDEEAIRKAIQQKISGSEIVFREGIAVLSCGEGKNPGLIRAIALDAPGIGRVDWIE